MARPVRTFTGQEGQRSAGSAGPDAIKRDLDFALKMFNPDETLPDGSEGGIGSENLKLDAATDVIIGDRTISDDTAPGSNTGTLTTLLSGFANRIKAITGGAGWKSAPATTLLSAKSHIDDSELHSGIKSINSITAPQGNVNISAGTGIIVSKSGKTITVTAQGNQAPGPHAATHKTGGSDELKASDIGLSNVQNYSIATRSEAEEGSAHDRYMTPERTAQAIEYTLAEGVPVHISQQSDDIIHEVLDVLEAGYPHPSARVAFLVLVPGAYKLTFEYSGDNLQLQVRVNKNIVLDTDVAAYNSWKSVVTNIPYVGVGGEILVEVTRQLIVNHAVKLKNVRLRGTIKLFSGLSPRVEVLSL